MELCPPLCPLCLIYGGTEQVFINVIKSEPLMAIPMEKGTPFRGTGCHSDKAVPPPIPAGPVCSTHPVWLLFRLQPGAHSPPLAEPGPAVLPVPSALPGVLSPDSEGHRLARGDLQRPPRCHPCLLDEWHLGPASPSSAQAGNTIR